MASTVWSLLQKIATTPIQNLGFQNRSLKNDCFVRAWCTFLEHNLCLKSSMLPKCYQACYFCACRRAFERSEKLVLKSAFTTTPFGQKFLGGPPVRAWCSLLGALENSVHARTVWPPTFVVVVVVREWCTFLSFGGPRGLRGANRSGVVHFLDSGAWAGWAPQGCELRFAAPA